MDKIGPWPSELFVHGTNLQIMQFVAWRSSGGDDIVAVTPVKGAALTAILPPQDLAKKALTFTHKNHKTKKCIRPPTKPVAAPNDKI
jgi:hypothetical protein